MTKVFTRDWHLRRQDVDDVKLLVYRTMHVPFCAACASRHRQLAERIGVVRRIASYFRTVYVIPLAIAMLLIVLYFFPALRGGAADLVAVPTQARQAAVIAMFAVANALVVWHQTRRWRVPPQTEVTSSFDFSDNLGNILGVEHRVYAMSNAAFAEAFSAANGPRLWTNRR